MSNPVCFQDYEAECQARLDPAAWAYLAGGAGDEVTLRANRTGLDRLLLNTRLLAETAGGTTRTTLLGQELPHPFLLAPIAYQRLFHPMGEIATAQAASAHETPMLLSTLASSSIEEVGQTLEGGPGWFQLYIQPDRDYTLDLVRRAEAAGFSAIVVTADAPVNGVRDRERQAGFALPPDIGPVNLAGMTPLPKGDGTIFGDALRGAPTWRDIGRLREATRLPLLVKGVMTRSDAERAMAAGCDGIIVSNHGGRVLDTVPAAIEALPLVVAAVAKRVPVLFDGGIRRGTDVLKAIALGASAVLLGRPYVHALSVGGAIGVAHAIRLLADEFGVAMALTGCARVEEIDRRVLFG